MSLHHAAQHLKAQGRGPDDQLIHMSGKEVAGLQALAKAHGGSLTINPETGLPEAGFLDNILPTLIGVGAAIAFPEFSLLGMGAPASIGLGLGAEEALRTGDLGKGLTAGLGAYGGAGMAGNLAATGESMVGADMSMSDKLGAGAEAFKASPEASMLGGWKNIGLAAAPAVMDMLSPKQTAPAGTSQMIRPYTFAANKQTPQNMVGAQYQPGQDTSERMWFQPQYTALTPYKAAAGGLMDIADMSGANGGPVEAMSNANAVGKNTGYPQADITGHAYATPWQTPVSQNVVTGSADTGVNRMTGEMNFAGGGLSSLAKSMAGEDVMPMEQAQRMAVGGVSHLGGYSDGGRLLKGPGDGMSDNIPAQIGAKQPARLADGEFVVPADVVSHLGNGSTDAGAKQLYKMMDRIRQQRTGKKKQAPQVNPSKAMPA